MARKAQSEKSATTQNMCVYANSTRRKTPSLSLYIYLIFLTLIVSETPFTAEGNGVSSVTDLLRIEGIY